MISKMILIPFDKLKMLESNVSTFRQPLIPPPQRPSVTTAAKLVRQSAMREKRLLNKKAPIIKKKTSTGDILHRLPIVARKKASNLLKHMKNTGNRLKWDPKSGEISFDGSTVPGSNIEELVRNIVSREKTDLHPGWQTFARGLDETDVPDDVIGTQQKIKSLKSSRDWSNLKWMIN